MKRKLHYLVLLSAVILNQTSASAQVDHGVFFDFNVGGVFNYSPTIQKDLKAPQYIGGNINFNKVAPTFGGGFVVLCTNRLIVGGNGFGYALTTNGNGVGIKDKMGAGLIDFGYSLSKIKTSKHLSFIFAGVGGYGTKFTVNNTSSENIYIDESTPTLPNKTSTYSTGGFSFEGGYSLKYYAFKMERKGRKRYGPVVGFDAGCQYYQAMGKWRDVFTRTILPDFRRPAIASPFVRISVGIADCSSKKSYE